MPGWQNLYRVRRGCFGEAILQQYFESFDLPNEPDSAWQDVRYSQAPILLQRLFKEQHPTPEKNNG